MIALGVGVVGSAGILALAASLGDWLMEPQRFTQPRTWLWSLAAMVVLQAMSTMVAAEMLQAVWPRRVLRRTGSAARQVVLGGVIGTLTMAAITLCEAFADPYAPGIGVWDAAICVACAAAVTWGVLLLCAKARRGHCERCGYDLRLLTVHSRGCCPECGHDALAPAGATPRRSRQAPSAQG